VWNTHLVLCAGWTSCGFLRSDQKNRMRSNSGSMSATLSLQPSGNIRNKPPCSCNIYHTHTHNGKNFKSLPNIIIYRKNKHVCCIGYLVIPHKLQISSPPLPPPLQMVTKYNDLYCVWQQLMACFKIQCLHLPGRSKGKVKNLGRWISIQMHSI